MLHRMKRLGLLAIVLALGCNTTSDGDTDTDGNSGGGSTASETDNVTTETATATASETANTESASGATTDGTSSSTTDASSSSGEESSSSAGSSESGSSSTEATSSTSSSTGDLGPQDLCESTDGMWEPAACGDYVCGIPNDCDAIVPGCDCGQDANFVEGEGCVLDDTCSTFDCGDEVECVTEAQYCMVTPPGVKGAAITYECMPMPDACADSINCLCLAAELMLPPPPICQEPTPGGLVIQVFLP